MAAADTSSQAPKRKAAPRIPPIERYDQLGPMPDDPLLMNEWAHRALGVAFRQVVRDPSLTEEKRLGLMTDLSARMAALTPMSRLSKAEAAVLGRIAGAAGDDGPKMVKADAAKDEAGDPGGSGAPARRGRPRRRAAR